jgi:hypothetical protein
MGIIPHGNIVVVMVKNISFYLSTSCSRLRLFTNVYSYVYIHPYFYLYLYYYPYIYILRPHSIQLPTALPNLYEISSSVSRFSLSLSRFFTSLLNHIQQCLPPTPPSSNVSDTPYVWSEAHPPLHGDLPETYNRPTTHSAITPGQLSPGTTARTLPSRSY